MVSCYVASLTARAHRHYFFIQGEDYSMCTHLSFVSTTTAHLASVSICTDIRVKFLSSDCVASYMHNI